MSWRTEGQEHRVDARMVSAGPVTETVLPTRRKARIRLALRLGLSLLVLASLLLFVSPGEVVQALRRLRLSILVAAVLAFLASHLVGVVKWRLLLAVARARMPYVEAVRCYYSGLFGNTLLPSIVGGDLVRAGLAMRATRSIGGVVLGSLAERFLDLVALVLLAATGAWLAPDTGRQAPVEALRWAALLLFAAAGAAALFAFYFPHRRLPRPLRRRLVDLRRSLRALVRRPGAVLVALALALVVQALFVAVNVGLSSALGFDIAWTVWLFAWPLAKIAALLPLTQAGLGVREAALVVLLAPFGIPAVAGLGVGLAFEAVVFLGSLTAGGVALLLHRRASRFSARRSLRSQRRGVR